MGSGRTTAGLGGWRRRIRAPPLWKHTHTHPYPHRGAQNWPVPRAGLAALPLRLQASATDPRKKPGPKKAAGLGRQDPADRTLASADLPAACPVFRALLPISVFRVSEFKKAKGKGKPAPGDLTAGLLSQAPKLPGRAPAARRGQPLRAGPRLFLGGRRKAELTHWLEPGLRQRWSGWNPPSETAPGSAPKASSSRTQSAVAAAQAACRAVCPPGARSTWAPRSRRWRKQSR